MEIDVRRALGRSCFRTGPGCARFSMRSYRTARRPGERTNCRDRPLGEPRKKSRDKEGAAAHRLPGDVETLPSLDASRQPAGQPRWTAWPVTVVLGARYARELAGASWWSGATRRGGCAAHPPHSFPSSVHLPVSSLLVLVPVHTPSVLSYIPRLALLEHSPRSERADNSLRAPSHHSGARGRACRRAPSAAIR
jgi:hypothetical protein